MDQQSSGVAHLTDEELLQALLKRVLTNPHTRTTLERMLRSDQSARQLMLLAAQSATPIITEDEFAREQSALSFAAEIQRTEW